MGTKRQELKAVRHFALVLGALLLIGFVVLERLGLIADYLSAPALYAKAKSLGMPTTFREVGQRESNQAGEKFLALVEKVSFAAEARGSLSMMPRVEEWVDIVYSVGMNRQDDRASGIVRPPSGRAEDIVSDDLGAFVYRSSLRRRGG